MLKSPYPAPPVLPPAGHPRLMLRERDFGRVRANIKKEKKAARLFEALCETEITGGGANPASGSYHLKEYLAAEAKALRALLDGDEARGREAVDALLLLLRTARFHGTGMAARFGGHLIFIASEVYDWCYNWLKADERAAIVAACESLAAAYFEMGYPPLRQSAISGHGTEAQLLRDISHMPARVKCAELAWRTLEEMLEEHCGKDGE